MKNHFNLLLAFVATSAVMMIFEFTNSLLFPFPEGMDQNSLAAVRSFSAGLPDTAMILVFCGWLFGTILGTSILLKRVQERAVAMKLAYILAVILTLFALLNNFLFIPDKIWVQVVTIPFFACVVYVVTKYYRN